MDQFRVIHYTIMSYSEPELNMTTVTIATVLIALVIATSSTLYIRGAIRAKPKQPVDSDTYVNWFCFTAFATLFSIIGVLYGIIYVFTRFA